jgi:hypothetical protein
MFTFDAFEMVRHMIEAENWLTVGWLMYRNLRIRR